MHLNKNSRKKIISVDVKAAVVRRNNDPGKGGSKGEYSLRESSLGGSVSNSQIAICGLKNLN